MRQQEVSRSPPLLSSNPTNQPGRALCKRHNRKRKRAVDFQHQRRRLLARNSDFDCNALRHVCDMHMLDVLEELDESLLSIDDFAAAWAAHERQAARLALAVARLEVSREYAADGAVTIAAWLRSHCRMADRDAANLVARGRFLRDHQLVADAAVTSRLSAGQVQALRSNVTSSIDAVFE